MGRVAIALMLLVTTASAEPSGSRRGFMMEAGIGAGTRFIEESGTRYGGGGFGFGVALGGFVTPSLAVTLRFAAVLRRETPGADGPTELVLGGAVLGPAALLLIPDTSFWVGAGGGLARRTMLPAPCWIGPCTMPLDHEGRWGWGMSARIGTQLSDLATLSVELMPSFYDGRMTTNVAVLLGFLAR